MHRKADLKPLEEPTRLLLGPGPSNADPRVLRALGLRQVGHLDPQFIGMMSEIQELLRYVWQTNNPMTIPVSGTGSAAMEASIVNLLEPGETVLVADNGYFGARMADMATRIGGKVSKLTGAAWGEAYDPKAVAERVLADKPNFLFLVHAETSTGVCQPLDGIADACKKTGTLLILDTVTSIGGVPLFLDAWGVDAAYAGGQKCLNCPPGVSPLTFGPRAMEKLNNRKTPVPNWYLDMSMLAKYWGTGKRTYHHTAPINMNYGMREALAIINQQGLEERWAKQEEASRYLYKRLEEIGLTMLVDIKVRLFPLTVVNVPEGVDPAFVIGHLMTKHNIEISGGLGALAGKVWRIGLMGYNATKENVDRFIPALDEAIKAAKANK